MQEKPRHNHAVKIILILVILYFPFKWFLWNPSVRASILKDIPTMEDRAFRERLSQASGFNGADLNEFSSTMSQATMVKWSEDQKAASGKDPGPVARSAYDRNMRPLLPGEHLQVRDSSISEISLQTAGKKYYFQEYGGSPIWKGCLYEDKTEGSRELVKIPGNCQSGTWLQIFASDKYPYLLVQDGPGGFVDTPEYQKPNYIVQDDGTVYKYIH